MLSIRWVFTETGLSFYFNPFNNGMRNRKRQRAADRNSLSLSLMDISSARLKSHCSFIVDESSLSLSLSLSLTHSLSLSLPIYLSTYLLYMQYVALFLISWLSFFPSLSLPPFILYIIWILVIYFVMVSVCPSSRKICSWPAKQKEPLSSWLTLVSLLKSKASSRPGSVSFPIPYIIYI